MPEHIGTKFIKKLFFCAEMCVKCTSSDIRPVYDFLYRNPVEFLVFQQGGKGVENCLTGFLLSSVHNLSIPPPLRLTAQMLLRWTFYPKCPVTYIFTFLVLVCKSITLYNIIEHYVR